MGKYGVTCNGFLPSLTPLTSLGPPYHQWEVVLGCLPSLLRAGGIRQSVSALPTLSVTALTTEAELRRAYVVLGFLSQAYIWGDISGGGNPAQVSTVSTQLLPAV